MLRRWAHLTKSEQLELELKLALARAESDFNWNRFCYDNNIRQWSLRRACDARFKSNLASRELRLIAQLQSPVVPRRRPTDERETVTAALMGDPHPSRSALAGARPWHPYEAHRHG